MMEKFGQVAVTAASNDGARSCHCSQIEEG